MTRQPESRRGELAQWCAELRRQGCTYQEIAGRIRGEQRVNARVAFRLAHGLTPGSGGGAVECAVTGSGGAEDG